MTTDVRERALLLGPRRALVGVLSEAARPGPRPAVVLLNSGIVHRVGANRIYVELARALAAAGHDVLRFDLSGVGDSPPRQDGLAPLDAVLADVREAVDELAEARPGVRVVLGGLCSGADHALAYAPSDPRVVGALLFDPALPLTARHYAYHYRARLLNRESWLNVLRGKNPLWRAAMCRLRSWTGEQPPAAPESLRAALQRPEVRAALEDTYRRMVERRIRMLAVLTGERSYYARQLADAFPSVRFGDLLRAECLRGADHMFTGHAERRQLLRWVLDWTSALDPESWDRRTGEGRPAP